MSRIEAAIDSAVTWLAVSVLGGIAWLVRRIFTNQQQIDLMKAEMERRERQRIEDRDQVAEIKRGVARIETWIMNSKK